jgi:hypothetical protein
MIFYLNNRRASDTLPQHAFEILVYAANHDYRDIMETAAPLVVFEKTMTDILPKLPSELVIPWVNDIVPVGWELNLISIQVMYHEQWHQVARAAVSYYDTWKELSSTFSKSTRYQGRIECSHCSFAIVGLDSYVMRLLRRLGGDIRGLEDLDVAFTSSEKLCKHIAPSFAPWRTSIEENIKNIPKFKPACVAHQ